MACCGACPRREDCNSSCGWLLDEINVWVKAPGKAPELRTVPNTLEAMQEIVDGYIETYPIAKNLVIICNEEGKLLGLDYNCKIAGEYFVGTLIFAGVDGEEFDDAPDEATMRTLLPHIWRAADYRRQNV